MAQNRGVLQWRECPQMSADERFPRKRCQQMRLRPYLTRAGAQDYGSSNKLPQTMHMLWNRTGWHDSTDMPVYDKCFESMLWGVFWYFCTNLCLNYDSEVSGSRFMIYQQHLRHVFLKYEILQSGVNNVVAVRTLCNRNNDDYQKSSSSSSSISSW